VTTRPAQPRRRGYTLVELILVIGILGLAGALVAPVLGNRGDFDTQALVRRLVADLTFAQMDALANQEFRRVQFLEDPQTGETIGWCILRLESDDLSTPFDPAFARYVRDPLAGGSDQAFRVDLTADRRFAAARIETPDFDGSRDFVTFDELGGTVTPSNQPGTGGSVLIRGSRKTYRVEVGALTGKITITGE